MSGSAAMAITHGNHSWKSPMAITHGNHPWQSLMEITHGNHSWKSPMAITHGSPAWPPDCLASMKKDKSGESFLSRLIVKDVCQAKYIS